MYIVHCTLSALTTLDSMRSQLFMKKIHALLTNSSSRSKVVLQF